MGRSGAPYIIRYGPLRYRPGMDPVVISPTIQEYAGRRYYLCGRYFRGPHGLLHRLVYAAHHGPIPDRCHVHHLDHDRANNTASNLALLPAGEHLAYHGARPSEAASAARARNAREHASPGNARLTAEQRSAAARRSWTDVALVEVACAVCGARMETPFPSRARYCGGTCRARARRARLAGGNG